MTPTEHPVVVCSHAHILPPELKVGNIEHKNAIELKVRLYHIIMLYTYTFLIAIPGGAGLDHSAGKMTGSLALRAVLRHDEVGKPTNHHLHAVTGLVKRYL